MTPRPSRTEILNFDNWTVTCQEFAESRQKICAANTQVVAQNTNQVVFIWSFGMKDGHLAAAFQPPTGLSLAPGIELKTAKSSKTIPYETCETGHCTASAAFDPAFTKDIVASPSAAVSIRSSNGNVVKFEVATKGLDKALAALPK